MIMMVLKENNCSLIIVTIFNFNQMKHITHYLFYFFFLVFSTIMFAQEKPNMLIFIADDHGRLDSPVYGGKGIRTPMMESLAKEGLVFDNAYVASPACGPSRCALLSGLMPARNKAEGNHTAPLEGTLLMVKKLQEQGYEVISFGKISHSIMDANNAGFDFASRNMNNLSQSVSDYLAKRTSKKPICIMVGDRRPHTYWTKNNIYDPTTVSLPSYFIDTPETRAHFARYLSDITGMDNEMNEVDEVVRNYLGTNNYFFMYTSDHGGQWPFGKWNLYDAGVAVPMIIRWPQMIKAGQRNNAMVSWVDIFPTLIDLAGGKVADTIDGKSFKAVLFNNKKDHRELIFTTNTGDKQMNVYPIRSVRDKQYKFIRNIYPNSYHSNHSDILREDGSGAYWDSWDEVAKTDPKAKAIIDHYYIRPAEEFYDLKNDPTEQVNLVNNPKYKSKISQISKMLNEWMKEQGDQVHLDYKPYPTSGPLPRYIAPLSELQKARREKEKKLSSANK